MTAAGGRIDIAVRPGDDLYPRRLNEVPDPADPLYVRGTMPIGGRFVAIVGSRAASGRGMAAARRLARELAGAGFGVIFGGAIGIDGAAHRGALDAGAPTCAVLATGVDVPYPARHRSLFADIVAARGALMSPFPAGSEPRRWRFVRRNRIIAGMADAVAVIDATLGSGALHTAGAARDYGRVVGACPGTPGCELLIAEGAAVVETAADLLAALAGTPRRPGVHLPDPDTDAGRVLTALARSSARSERELSERTGLALRAVSRALVGLELEGLAVLLPGRAYVRSCLAEELLVE